MFHPINKDERLLGFASDIKVLRVQVERYCLGKNGEPSKRSMGSPKKVVEAHPSQGQRKDISQKMKGFGAYKHWFTSLLWVPIDTAFKRHANLIDALH